MLTLETSQQTFGFEAEFVGQLKCLPMVVRYKLDIIGIKLSLKDWLGFEPSVRQAILEAPFFEKDQVRELQTYVAEAVRVQCHHEPVTMMSGKFPWDEASVNEEVQKAASLHLIDLKEETWRNLPILCRFALCKLARPNHESRNFLPALIEFGLQHATKLTVSP